MLFQLLFRVRLIDVQLQSNSCHGTGSCVLCSVPGSQQWFVLKNLNAASSVYYVKIRAVNGRGAGAASATIAVSTHLTGSTFFMLSTLISLEQNLFAIISYNCKKNLQFIHMLTVSNTSKTAKIIKGDITYHHIMIFAVFDVLLTVNMCINYSFFYIYNNNNKQTFQNANLN